jgi:hypothetical protein
MIGQDTIDDFEDVRMAVSELITTAQKKSSQDIVTLMKKIVPEFKSMNSEFQVLDIE